MLFRLANPLTAVVVYVILYRRTRTFFACMALSPGEINNINIITRTIIITIKTISWARVPSERRSIRIMYIVRWQSIHSIMRVNKKATFFSVFYNKYNHRRIFGAKQIDKKIKVKTRLKDLWQFCFLNIDVEYNNLYARYKMCTYYYI